MGKNRIKREGEFSDLEVLKVLGEDTKNKLIKNKAQISKCNTVENKKIKYGKKKVAVRMSFHYGYDLLQYSIVVKPFIYKKYNIKSPLELDALLYLFPIQYFTVNDFKFLPLRQYGIYLKTMIENGYIELCVKKVAVAGNIYTLTDHSVRIVKDYYAYLSGEKTIGNTSYTNPFKDTKATKADRLRERLMLKLKALSESSPSNFRKNLY